MINNVDIGRFNSLEVLKKVDFGIYLDGGDGIEILMPKRYVPEDVEIGQMLDAFIYRDSEDRLIATTTKPLLQVGECAYLKVQAVNHIGAFLDWGLPKDLLVPFNQMTTPLKEGESCMVTAYVDKKSGRIAASTRLSLFLKETGTGFHIGQQVALQIVSRSDLGVKAVVNGTHLGLIFHAEIKQNLSIGEKLTGFIKRVRTDDQRIDLALDAGRALTRQDLHGEIIQHLKENDGAMTVTDKSTPEAIMDQFGVSKAAFKKALGALYKDKLISLSAEEVKLLPGAEAKLKKKSKVKPPVKSKAKSPVKSGEKPRTLKDSELGKKIPEAKSDAKADKVSKKPKKAVSERNPKPEAAKFKSESGSKSKPDEIEEEEVIDPSSPWAAAMKKSKSKKG